MNRRHFFNSLTAAAGAAALPSTLLAQPVRGAAPQASPLFDNRARTPLRGWHGQDVHCESALIEGKLPAELRGVFYRNGPGLFERGGQRYDHWFDGDGLVHAWRFTDQGVSHRARFVKTAKFKAEQEANEFLYPAFGTAIRPKRPLRSNDSMNTANTSAVRLGDHVLALWEGGSAHRLDPETLETRGIVDFGGALKGLPFSAHPKIEPDGTFWNFGTLFGKMVVYHLSPTGDLKRHAVFEMPASAMVHDFVVTERHLVFLIPPIGLDMAAVRAGQKSMIGAMQWRAADGIKVLIVDKDDFSKRRVLEMPAFMVFHFGNAWERDGVIRLDCVKTQDLAIMNEWMPRLMRGEEAREAPSQATFVTVNLNTGKVGVESRSEDLEFPRVDPRVVARRNRYVFYPVAATRGANSLDGVMRLDTETGKTDVAAMGNGISLEEHVLVPKPGSSKEGEGWLVGVGFDAARQQSFATVWDAMRLSSGPVAIARLPYWTPYCFHGHFHA
ncbi:MAG: carotenoid oxygenase family protein [Betaproteobacteria bacterium]|nr:carotenoid oxygenase family protein [Betaproteobacteria bacterium]